MLHGLGRMVTFGPFTFDRPAGCSAATAPECRCRRGSSGVLEVLLDAARRGRGAAEISTPSGRTPSSPIRRWPRPSACCARPWATTRRRRATSRRSTAAATVSSRPLIEADAATAPLAGRSPMRRSSPKRCRRRSATGGAMEGGACFARSSRPPRCGSTRTSALRWRPWSGCGSRRRRERSSTPGRRRLPCRRMARWWRGPRATRRAGCTSGGSTSSRGAHFQGPKMGRRRSSLLTGDGSASSPRGSSGKSRWPAGCRIALTDAAQPFGAVWLSDGRIVFGASARAGSCA